MLNTVLKKMVELLQRKKTALKKLVDKAEENVVYFEEQPYGTAMLTLEDVPFFNMKEVYTTKGLTFSPRFRQRVSFNESGVHIPVDIFDGCKYNHFLS